MSVIAGKVYKDKIVVAADSIIVCGWSKRTDFNKLVEVNDMLIGGTGYSEELSLMFHFAKTHKPEKATERDVLTFMVEFMEWKKKIVEDSLENSYLIAIDGHLFSTSGMFVEEVKDFEAIGAGMDYANAAMYLGHTPQEAVKVACDLCCMVSEPITTFEIKR